MAAAFDAAAPFTAFTVDHAVFACLLACTGALFAEHPTRALDGAFARLARTVGAAVVEWRRLAEAGITAAVAFHTLLAKASAASRAEEEVAAQITFAGESRPAAELTIHAAFKAHDIDNRFNADAHIGEEGFTDRTEGADLTRATRLAVSAAFGSCGARGGSHFAHPVHAKRA